MKVLFSRLWIFSIVFLSLSCELALISSYQNHKIPRFSVDPLAGSGISGSVASSPPPWEVIPSQINSLFLPSFPPILPIIGLAVAQEGPQESIDCTQAGEDYGKTSTHYTNGLRLVERFYREAIFFDCLLRYNSQQEELGVSKRVIDFIDEENETPVYKEVDVLTVSRIKHPEDDLLFISWTDDPNALNVRGRMVGKLFQSREIIPSIPKGGEDIRVKSRIDLKITNGARSVYSMQKDEKNNKGAYSKAVFIEIPNANDSIDEHYVGGRYYDNLSRITFRKVQASVRRGLGTSVFFTIISECPNSNIDLVESPSFDNCRVDNKEEYYDNHGNRVDRAKAMAIGLKTNPSSLPNVDSFYNGQSEDAFFRPEF